MVIIFNDTKTELGSGDFLPEAHQEGYGLKYCDRRYIVFGKNVL